jgi:ABC-type phosphate/phosphonate transport system substrate-binding protein
MIVLIPLPAAGCSRERAHNPAKSEHHQQTLVIGLVPGQSMFKQVHRDEPIADYLPRNIF